MNIYGLVGFPLGHSFSGGYFAQKFTSLGIDEEYSYDNFTVEDIEQLPHVLPSDIRGFNITIPHKQNIIPMLSEIDPEAELVGAVNCVRVMDNGTYKGYNTDVYGFEMSLRDMLRGGGIPELKALVLGTGGASRAVCYVLSKLGITYTEVSRTGVDATRISYDQLTPEITTSHRLIINTTPLGMSPNMGICAPIPYDSIGKEHYLYDLIYNPAETSFILEGRIRGARVKSGLQMLILQAERSWEIWNS